MNTQRWIAVTSGGRTGTTVNDFPTESTAKQYIIYKLRCGDAVNGYLCVMHEKLYMKPQEPKLIQEYYSQLPLPECPPPSDTADSSISADHASPS